MHTLRISTGSGAAYAVTINTGSGDGTIRLDVLDNDKVYFCSDYPFEKMEDAADWYDKTGVIDDEQRRRIGRTNAIRLFKLDLE